MIVCSPFSSDNSCKFSSNDEDIELNEWGESTEYTEFEIIDSMMNGSSADIVERIRNSGHGIKSGVAYFCIRERPRIGQMLGNMWVVVRL